MRRHAQINWQDPIDWGDPLSKGTVAWWLVQPHAKGGTVFRDLTGRHHGTLTNMDLATDWVGPGNRKGGFGALNFDGNNDLITVPHNSQLSVFGTAISISVFIRPNFTKSAPNNMLIIDKTANNNSAYRLMFNRDIDDFRFRIFTTSAQNCDTIGLPWAAGEWHHLGGTYDGSNICIYWDGVLKNTVAKTGNITTSLDDFTIGMQADASLYPFNGQLDDIRVWNRALSAAEVMDYYLRSQQGYPGLLRRVHVPFYSQAGVAPGIITGRHYPRGVGRGVNRGVAA